LRRDLEIGDTIASLVSLSLTPLNIERIVQVHLEKDQIDIEGKAVLFESGIYARLPSDIPPKMALAVLDVAGAPAQVDKLVKKGMNVAILGGGGKSGLLCCYAAMKKCRDSGKVVESLALPTKLSLPMQQNLSKSMKKSLSLHKAISVMW
jgi:L-erythro-3,5-diaminohexanoate dehydrogenase